MPLALVKQQEGGPEPGGKTVAVGHVVRTPIANPM